MRRFSLALFCAILLAHPALAESNRIEAEHPEIGKVKITTRRYDHALGVVSELTRAGDRNVECTGLCYFLNGSKSISWRCGPRKACNLFCTVKPPAGGCN